MHRLRGFLRELGNRVSLLFGIRPSSPTTLRSDDFDTIYSELERELNNLSAQFLATFQGGGVLVPPEEYRYQVQAFCVLFHSALEHYFEKIALKLMEMSLAAFINPKKRTSLTLFSLAVFSAKTIKIDSGKRVFDDLRGLTREIRTTFSKIVDKNHGASKDDLVKILKPVGIDLTEDVNLLDSLLRMNGQRGDSAHKMAVTKVLPPDDAIDVADDCMKIAFDVKEKAKQVLRA